MARIAALLLLLLLVPCARARADAWRPVQQSCVSPDTSGGRCAAAHSGSVLAQPVIGPGGTVAYVASFQILGGSGNAILIFNRDPVTGQLTQRAGKAGCISQDGTGNTCDTVTAFGPNSMVVSPDGKQLYVEGGFTVWTFDIQPDGGLKLRPGADGCLTNLPTTGCTDVRGLQGPLDDIAISADGKNVYAAGSQLAVFNRTATGTLQQAGGAAGCFSPFDSDGCTTVVGLARGAQMSVSPDQRSIYVTGGLGLVEFERNLANGALRRIDCITNDGSGNQCVADPRLIDAAAAVTSPDGRQVYVSTTDGVITYARAADGRLTSQSCINDRGTSGCSAGVQVRGLSFMALSPDGRDLVASSALGGDFDPGFNGGIVSLSRDPVTGNLTQPAGPDACVTNDGSGFDEGVVSPGRCLTVPVSTGPARITFASDSQFYAGGSFSGAVIVYKRDFYPTCASQTVTIPHDAATPVGLQCEDRNGDPLTLRLSAPPLSGTLGGIDQAGRRATYVPFAGFAGPDAFRFNAVAAGLTSADATMSLNVAAVAPGGGGGGPIDADHDGFFSGQDCNDHDAAIHPGAREVRGNRVDENCDGLSEPFPTLSTGVSTKWRVTGARLTLTQLRFSQPPRDAKLEIRCAGSHCPFKRHAVKGKLRGGFVNGLPSLGRKVRFRAGQTIEVRVSAPGFNTKVAQLKLRKGQVPTTVPLCLPPGTSQPRRTCD